MNRTTNSDLPRELLIQITCYLQDTHPCLPLMLPHTRFSEHTPALSCAVITPAWITYFQDPTQASFPPRPCWPLRASWARLHESPHCVVFVSLTKLWAPGRPRLCLGSLRSQQGRGWNGHHLPAARCCALAAAQTHALLCPIYSSSNVPYCG